MPMPSNDFPVFTKTFHSSVYPSIDPTSAALSSKGKVVLVTGGGRGIGKAIATAFAKAGARAVIVIGRTEATLKVAEKEISEVAQNAGSTTIVRSFAADVANAETLSHVFKSVSAEFGAIDVVVNNAAVLHLGTLGSTNLEHYWSAFETNVKGSLNLMQAFAQSSLDRDITAPATFINVSSVGLIMPTFPTWSNYVATKLAAFSMTQYLAAESGGKIRAFSIHPGRVETDMAKENGIPTFEDPGRCPCCSELWYWMLTFGQSYRVLFVCGWLLQERRIFCNTV